MKYYQTLRNESYMTDMENKAFGKAAAAAVAWTISSRTFSVGDCSASWAIRVEVGMAEEEEKIWCIHSSEYLFPLKKKKCFPQIVIVEENRYQKCFIFHQKTNSSVSLTVRIGWQVEFGNLGVCVLLQILKGGWCWHWVGRWFCSCAPQAEYMIGISNDGGSPLWSI